VRAVVISLAISLTFLFVRIYHALENRGSGPSPAPSQPEANPARACELTGGTWNWEIGFCQPAPSPAPASIEGER
jgi:hypothetical protein